MENVSPLTDVYVDTQEQRRQEELRREAERQRENAHAVHRQPHSFVTPMKVTRGGGAVAAGAGKAAESPPAPQQQAVDKQTAGRLIRVDTPLVPKIVGGEHAIEFFSLFALTRNSSYLSSQKRSV